MSLQLPDPAAPARMSVTPVQDLGNQDIGNQADLITAAVRACPDVTAMSVGTFGEIRCYLPGRSVPGVKLDEHSVEVHVVARYGPPLGTVAEQIASALAPLLAGRELRIAVDDIAVSDEPSGARENTAAGAADVTGCS